MSDVETPLLVIPNLSRGQEAVLVRFLDLWGTPTEHRFQDKVFYRFHWTVSTDDGLRVLPVGPVLQQEINDFLGRYGPDIFLDTTFRLYREGFAMNTTYHLEPT